MRAIFLLISLEQNETAWGDKYMEEDRTNKKFWDKVAFLYTRFMNSHNAMFDELAAMIELKLHPEMKVLELACGTGQLTLRLYDKVFRWLPSDYSPKMVREAEKRSTNLKLDFRVMDATQIDYPDKSFDAVLIANALHIMPEPEKALKEISRVLRDNGVLIAPTFVYEPGYGKFRIWLMEKFGFKTYHKWSAEDYVNFIQDNNFFVSEAKLFEAGPIYECMLIAIKGDK